MNDFQAGNGQTPFAQDTLRTTLGEVSTEGRELSQDEIELVAGGGLIRNCGPDGTVIQTSHGIFCD